MDKLKLLVVEDDTLTATLLVEVLQGYGFDSELAHTIQDARNLLHKNQFQGAFLDYFLPDGTGLEVARLLREQTQDAQIPIIMISSDQGLEKVQAEGEQFDAIVKPLNLKQVKKVLDHIRHNFT